MASPVEEELECPTCLKDPVALPCGHKVCLPCMQRWRDEEGDRSSCPVCQKRSRSLDPPMNFARTNVCEAFPQTSVVSERLCSLQKEKLKLFCLDLQDLVCRICRDAKIPDGEVAQHTKDKLQEGLQDAKTKLEDCNENKDNCQEQLDHIEVQSEQIESKMKELEELQAEEEDRLSEEELDDEGGTRGPQ
ncbi:E3 ubiquitin-protein ligase TRIM39-like [Festucalex cinctus]